MATRADIEWTYNYMDRLWRASLGDHADITCAYFDGNYSKTLEQAQRDKYDRILALTEFRPGDRVLDVGCGWGGRQPRICDEGAGAGVECGRNKH